MKLTKLVETIETQLHNGETVHLNNVVIFDHVNGYGATVTIEGGINHGETFNIFEESLEELLFEIAQQS